MPKGKKLVREIKQSSSSSKKEGIDIQALHDMMSILAGDKAANINIIIPKILEVRSSIYNLFKVLNVFTSINMDVEAFPEMKNVFKDIKEYTKTLETEYDLLKSVDGKTSYNEMKKESFLTMKKEDVNSFYTSMKNTTSIKSLIISSGNLHKYCFFLADKNKLDDKFIIKEPGSNLQPLSFTTLDLKSCWGADSSSSVVKKTIMSILHHIYTKGFTINKIITSPDIDVKKFCSAVVSKLSGMRKQIPRCNLAFNIIENSVGLMEGNFENYYRSAKEANNMNIILESFVVDISNNTKHNKEVVAQFRTLIKELSIKASKGNKMDPKILGIFKSVSNKLSEISDDLPESEISDDTPKSEISDDPPESEVDGSVKESEEKKSSS